MPWAIKWRSDNRLDGKREVFIGRFAGPDAPFHMKGYSTAVFENRESARDFIKSKYGYIAWRPDLRREPHGWRTPIAVKVEVVIKEVATLGRSP